MHGAVTSITITSRGSGYTSAPTVSFTGGGSGSGATAAATIGGSFVTSLTLTNPGVGPGHDLYQLVRVLQSRVHVRQQHDAVHHPHAVGGYLASDVLTVAFSGGGGTGAAASAHVWPFVTAGTTLAVFAGRVWFCGGNLLQFTGTQGFDDFNAANAAGSLTIKDADSVHAIMALLQQLSVHYGRPVGHADQRRLRDLGMTIAGTLAGFTFTNVACGYEETNLWTK